MSYWYLATPYTKFPGGYAAAHRAAAIQSGVLLRGGVPVFSPIVHSHPIAETMPADAYSHVAWLRLDLHMIRPARGLIVCRLAGWSTSYGVQWEIEEFRKLGKPIVYMMPGVIPAELYHATA